MTVEAVEEYWSHLAKEKVSVEKDGEATIAYGSELACLRLLANFRRPEVDADVGFSDERDTWYFSHKANASEPRPLFTPPTACRESLTIPDLTEVFNALDEIVYEETQSDL